MVICLIILFVISRLDLCVISIAGSYWRGQSLTSQLHGHLDCVSPTPFQISARMTHFHGTGVVG